MYGFKTRLSAADVAVVVGMGEGGGEILDLLELTALSLSSLSSCTSLDVKLGGAVVGGGGGNVVGGRLS